VGDYPKGYWQGLPTVGKMNLPPHCSGTAVVVMCELCLARQLNTELREMCKQLLHCLALRQVCLAQELQAWWLGSALTPIFMHPCTSPLCGNYLFPNLGSLCGEKIVKWQLED
jgi:hypothetical protein